VGRSRQVVFEKGHPPIVQGPLTRIVGTTVGDGHIRETNRRKDAGSMEPEHNLLLLRAKGAGEKREVLH